MKPASENSRDKLSMTKGPVGGQPYQLHRIFLSM